MIRFSAGDGQVRRLDYPPGGGELVVQEGGPDHAEWVRWWDWRAGKERRAVRVRDDVVFSPDHARAAMSGFLYDSAIHLLGGKSLRKRAALEVGWALGAKFTFTPDGRHLLSADADGDVHYWDVRRKERVYSFALGEWGAAVAASPGGGRLAALDRRGNLHVWPADAPHARRKQRVRPGQWAWSMTFLDEERVAVVYRGVLVWDAAVGRACGALKGQASQVNGLAISPDRRLLATASNDGAVCFWDALTRQLRQAFDWGIGAVHAVAFAPDGMTCAAGGERGQVVVWDVEGQ